MKLRHRIKLPHKYLQLESARQKIEKSTENARRQLKIHRLQRSIKRVRRKQHRHKHQHILPLLQHLLPLWVIALMQNLAPVCLLTSILLATPLRSEAQVLKNIFSEDYRIDSIQPRSLRAEVDAVAFFHDNEYTSKVATGYSLPGVRLNPHLAYNPSQQINLEAGVSMLIFNGANKYPCYAYHDIGTWKGNQYQQGAHLLPWVRLQASWEHIDFVLGNIYGGSNHRLSTPLFNPEQNLSADPETGTQILIRYKHLQSDTWLNWQSYIFKMDSHQEAFIVGENLRLIWGKANKRWNWYTPLQLVIQHRGGEQDTTRMGTQTLCNMALGIGVEGNPASTKVNTFSAQANTLISYQQKGSLWPFDKGIAFHTGFKMRLLSHLCLSADYLFAPRQFITLLGNPFFGTISIKHPGTTYKGNSVTRIGVGYQHTFSNNNTFGAQAEVFNNYAGQNGAQPRLFETNFSFGIFFRVAPSLLIKKFD